MKKNVLDWIALIVVVLAAINWGLIGIFRIDVVALVFGTVPVLARLAYTVAGFAGIVSIHSLTKS